MGKRLSPPRRVHTRTQYLACYRGGERHFSRGFILYIRRREPDGLGLRLGIAVTKKVGKAVTRNHLKRLIREVFRLNQLRFGEDVDIVVVAKKGIEARHYDYWRVERELMQTLARTLHLR